jgi:folate-binding protein YgfZ
MVSSHQILRGCLKISGQDSASFLQNLITHDIELLVQNPYLHACLLTPQGKFLHDFFITKTDNGFLLNAEPETRATDLYKKLSLYKLRAAVEIIKEDDRLSYRTPYGYSFDDEKNAMDEDTWEKHRFSLARADGSRDADIGTSTLDELNLTASAVSYTKGCYVGQELTARMHHRGLGKKHLHAVEFDKTAPERDTELPNKIGIMRSSYGRYGLALIRDEIATTLPKTALGFIRIS